MKTTLETLWRGWLVVAKTIGAIQSRLVLTLVYFVAIAPFALAIRFFSDPLSLRGAPCWHSTVTDHDAATGLGTARQQF